MIKANLHLKNSYAGDLSEYSPQRSCTNAGNQQVKGPPSESGYSVGACWRTKPVRNAEGAAGALLSLCSPGLFSPPSVKVVDSADSRQSSKEQRLGHKVLTSFVGDPSTLFIIVLSLLLILPCLLGFPPRWLEKASISFHAPALSLTC